MILFPISIIKYVRECVFLPSIYVQPTYLFGLTIALKITMFFISLFARKNAPLEKYLKSL